MPSARADLTYLEMRLSPSQALRYFAPAAAPLNKQGASLPRAQQMALEQPACVHASMDMLKIALKLQPWVEAELVGERPARLIVQASTPTRTHACARERLREGPRAPNPRRVPELRRVSPIARLRRGSARCGPRGTRTRRRRFAVRRIY